jgi:predicted amidohydrolase YtcJ
LETSWAQDRLGPERSKLVYGWGSLLASGARAAGGSDAPTFPCNPLHGIHAAVTRQDLKGQPPEGWNLQEKITALQALKLFTIDAAHALFEDDIKGSLEQGKLADLVVLSKDILSIPADQIPTTEVEMTVVGGEVVYEK